MSDADTKLIDFAKAIIRLGWQGDIGGDEVQELAEKHGLIAQVPFDPKVHNDPDLCMEPGQPWYVFAGPLTSDFPNPLAHMRPEGDR